MTISAIFGCIEHPIDEVSLGRMSIALRHRVPRAARQSHGPCTLAGTRVVRLGESILTIDAMLVASKDAPTPLEDLAERIAHQGLVAIAETLEGAFAIAFWDGTTKRLSITRDATGQRCLYVARTAHGLAFASEPKALLARHDIARDIDPLALARYLSMAYLPGESTLVAAVREVPPATVLTFDERGIELSRHRYWSPKEPSDLTAREAHARSPNAVDSYASALRETLDDVVRSYQKSTDSLGPAAAFLSGGVDSSLVVALASKIAPPPACFSISFGSDLPNELAFSSLLAKHVGAKHEVLEVLPDAMSGALTRAIYYLDDPIGDPLTVPNYLLAERAAQHGFRRVWNGEGGDPCFGGPKNIPMMLAEQYGENGPGDRERGYLRAYQKLFDDLNRLFLPDVFARATKHESVEAILTPFFDDDTTHSFLNKLQNLNLVLKGGSHILVKVDKMYGAHGLTPLSPLFDRRVAERAWETPPSLKLRGNVEKFVLKEAVKDVVPPAIIERKKSGMLVPVHPWFRGPLKDLFQSLLGPEQVAKRGLFRPNVVAQIANYRGASGVRGFYGAKLWLLLTLEVWMTLFLDGGAESYLEGEPDWIAKEAVNRD